MAQLRKAKTSPKHRTGAAPTKPGTAPRTPRTERTPRIEGAAPRTEGYTPRPERAPRSEGSASRPVRTPRTEGATPRPERAPRSEGSASRPVRTPRTEGATPRPERGPRSEGSSSRPERAPRREGFVPRPDRATRVAAKAPRTVSPLQSKKGPSAKAPEGERLQKILAHAGVASRRACETLILEGHVQVNGVTITELGARANPYRDVITLDFEPVQKEQPVYILMNKPKGYVTTVKDEEGRPTVMALLNGISARVYPVGRLDFNSEGLLLMTNDGELAQRLTSPDFHIPKVYLVKIHRTPRPETLDEFREGFRLDGRRLKPCGIEVHEKGDNPWLQVTLTEGKNQQIRKMFAAVGHPVSKLRRIQFGPLEDPALKPGHWRHLTAQELAALKSL